MKNKEFECSAVLNGIEIELTNYCGLDCFGCIRKQNKLFGYLKFKTLKNIINFIKNENYTEIVFSGLGDVFLHDKLYDFIDYIFYTLPNIKIYIMTKGQSIKLNDIDRIGIYKARGFNLGLTYSIFSLDREEYKKLTGGGDLDNLLFMIKQSHNKKINYSFEFLLTNKNIQFIEKFKQFCDIFKKDFFYSIPHNWGGNLQDKEYNKIFSMDIMNNYIKIRKKGEICEAFKSKYLFFDFLGNIYKCGLKRLNNDLYLGNINDISFKNNFIEIEYNKCTDCSYFIYKTNI